MPLDRSRSLMTALLLAAGRVAASPVDFSFKPGMELERALETVAVMGKFNVVVCPRLGPVQTAYSVRLTEPVDALAMLARVHGLTVRKVADGAGGPTFAVGRPEQIRERFDTPGSFSMQLRHAVPDDVVKHLKAQLEPGVGLIASADPRTRRLVLRGPEDVLAKARELIRELDVPVPQATLHLTLTAGEAGKGQVVWKGSQVMLANETARVTVESPGKPAANGWRAGKIDGTFRLSVNAEDICTLKAEVDVNVEGAPGAIHATLSGNAQSRSGQEIALGSHELGGERSLQLTARVDVGRYPAQDALEDTPDNLDVTGPGGPPRSVSGSGPGTAPPTPPAPSPAAPSPAPNDPDDLLDLRAPDPKPTPAATPSAAPEIDTDL